MIEKYFNKDLEPFSEKMKKAIFEVYKNDVGNGDITTEAIVKPMIVKAIIKSKENGILAGNYEVRHLFEKLDIKVKTFLNDGDEIKKGSVIMEIEGDIRKILQAERTVLNFLSRLSGVATATHEIASKTKLKVTATRKTILPFNDKRAVVLGGGYTHRLGLFDQYLIKDNHISAVQKELNCFRTEAIKECIRRVKKTNKKNFAIEIEAENFDEAIVAAKERPDIIMLDNIKIDEMKKIAEKLKGSGIILEASGGITEKNIKEIEKTGVDVVSSGYITHSFKPLDMTLELFR
jgi:nicotinate-nucleotide pyrophosphorylase (carboxylating)